MRGKDGGRSAFRFVLVFLAAAVLVAGCGVSAGEKTRREKTLKETCDLFIRHAVQDEWDDAFALSDAGFESADALQAHFKGLWVTDAVLTGGVISSMAWVSDDITKVKVNWSFQAGTVPSYSSETLAWEWKGEGWRYRGRVLR